MDTQYRKNLKAVLTASKAYTDKTKEEIYWHIGDYSISTQSDNTTASTKTVPSGATRCKIKRIYGNCVKYAPSVAYDDSVAKDKTMPNVVYDFDCSVVYGNSEVSENKIILDDEEKTTGIGITYLIKNGAITFNGTTTGGSFQIKLKKNINVNNLTITAFNSTAIPTMNMSIRDVNNAAIDFVVFDSVNARKTITITSEIGYIGFYFGSNLTFNNYTIKPMLVSGSTAPTEFKQGFEGIHNLELSGLVVKNSDDEVMQTLPIDLSTILYNGNPLFEGNSLKAVNDVKDSITPYKATKKLGYVDLGSLVWVSASANRFNSVSINTLVKAPTTDATQANILCDKLTTAVKTNIELISNQIAIDTGGAIWVSTDGSYSTAEAFKTAMSGVYLVYELATPIEVSIDWSSTLRGIQGYSNGTITLLNTNNQDTANTITYNSIIQENCCAKIVQSRGGSVVKTISLTDADAEYGYSSTNENNIRDYTTNVGTINVGKRAYESGDEEDTDVITDMQYTYYPLTTPTTETLTAIDNIIEVEPNDTIVFLDENDNAVNVPSDLTYRIEVERV